MKKEKIFKYLSFGLFAVIAAILVTATVAEKLNGTEYVQENIYCAEWMIALWGIATVSAIAYLLQRRMHRQPFTLSLHLSFAVILTGAVLTHYTGKQGQIHLRIGESVGHYTLNDGSAEKFPFTISLNNFEVLQYAGTQAPTDFASTIVIYDSQRTEGNISMNNIFKHRGYRFYQSGYDSDKRGTFLTISYDPWGIGITYAGYAMLLVSMQLFFLQKGSRFRTLLHKNIGKGGLVLTVLLFTAATANGKERPRTLPADAASEFCGLHVCYNDRICPLQTLAIDFTAKVYGKRNYEGYTAEQVLCGWFFFYDDWKDEPMIKIKGEETKRCLGIEGEYAALTDFTDRNGYKLEEAMHIADGNVLNDLAAANEKFNIISMLCTGMLMKIFPLNDTETGNVTWYSFAERVPGSIPQEQQLFINKSMNLVAEMVAAGEYSNVVAMLDKIKRYQIKAGAGSIPSESVFEAERIYNSINSNRLLAIIALATGLISFMLFCLQISAIEKAMQAARRILKVLAFALLAYLTAIIALRWYISGHIPLSNGHETMMFMAWCSLLPIILFNRKNILLIPFGYIVCGLTMLVATMGEATPQITPLMPVLQSPLLCIHVVVIMISYTLLAFAMLNGVAAFIIKATRKNPSREISELQRRSLIMLYPAVFLLTAGIFIGAVWANVSWGRYWGWDPKEVWALITLFVYSATLHGGSIKAMRHPMFFHAYCIVAFLSVLITYFGVNFILGGMHSYA